jgi:GAF domain-containing protein
MTLDPTLEPDDGPLRADDGLDRLGRLSLVDQSMRSLLDQVVRLAQRCLPRQPEASLTLMRGLRPHTAAFSGDLAMDLDESQYGHGYGPCLQAASSGEVVEVVDTRTDRRWRGCLETAVQRGCLSSLAAPLPFHQGVRGALNVYAREPAAFDADSRALASRLASYTAVLAGNMLRAGRDDGGRLPCRPRPPEEVTDRAGGQGGLGQEPGRRARCGVQEERTVIDEEAAHGRS